MTHSLAAPERAACEVIAVLPRRVIEQALRTAAKKVGVACPPEKI